MTQILKPHNRELMITQLAPVIFDPGAKCPLWLEYLDKTFPKRKQVIAFLQRSLGYSMLGVAKEQCFWILKGNGRNGKGILVNAMIGILGDYATEISFETICFRTIDSSPAINVRDGLATLVNARFIKTSEPDESKPLNAALVKKITGDHAIRTALLYEQEFSYIPKFKLWLVTNTDPIIADVSDGMWDRIHQVNFDRYLSPEERDLELGEKLKEEYSGIFNWLLQGVYDYCAKGLCVPVEVREAVSQYRRDQNPIAPFVEDKCTITRDRNDEIPGKEFTEAFNTWALVRRRKKRTQSDITMALKPLGVVSRRSHGETIYIGINWD